MMHAACSLRRAIHQHLAADSTLVALLGGARIFDEVPRAAQPPYVVLGEMSVKDASTSLSHGHEHALLLAIWSADGSALSPLAIAAAAQASLEAMGPILEDHRLVNLVVTGLDVGRDAKRRLVRVTLRARAVTESI